MKEIRILPIVVIYRADYATCSVFRTMLSHYPEAEVMLYDNSPESINTSYAGELVHYIHNPANGGVSAAYNAGAKWAAERGVYTHLLLLDHDTEFSPPYIHDLQRCIALHPDAPLLLPIIKLANGAPFSPVARRGSTIPTPGEHVLSSYRVVNSGACVQLSAFMRVGGYDERIKLDFADTYFFRKMVSHDDRFILTDSEAWQDFSNDDTDTERLYQRFLFYLSGAREYRKIESIGCEVLRHTLALTLRTRSPRFLMTYINKYIL